MKPHLSPRDLAKAIGVSESSVKRWVDDERIHASRTAGGHRKIAFTEAVRFLRESKTTLARPEVLGLKDLIAVRGKEQPPEEALFTFLRQGAAAEASGLLLSLYLSGRGVAEIVDGALKEALRRIGELWQHDDSGIFWEHRATAIAIRALTRLGSLIRAPTGGLVAVGGAPSGDPYIIPSLAVATVLEAEGVVAINLGPDTPATTLALAARELGAGLVWLSVSYVADETELVTDLTALLESLHEGRAALVIGGARSTQLRLPADPLVFKGSSMGELRALLHGLKLHSA